MPIILQEQSPLMTSFYFKTATVNDVEALAEISRSTFYDTYHKLNTEEDMQLFIKEMFNEQVLTEEIQDPHNQFILLYLEEELVGYAMFSEEVKRPELSTTDTIEIARIYVTQSQIGKGLGAALMQKCIDVAREGNKQVIWLGVWEHNHNAKSFYSRWGFEKFGEHHFKLGNDLQNDWLLKKLI